jgi:hypothetical protein
MKWKLDQLDSYADRMRRSSREIIIAAALTIAALTFLVAALAGGAVKTGPDKVGAVASDSKTIK